MKAPLTGHQRKAGTDRAAATFAWLDQIADDAGLPPVAARVAIVLRRYFNGKTGAAWPSQDRGSPPDATTARSSSARARAAFRLTRSLGRPADGSPAGPRPISRRLPPLANMKTQDRRSARTSRYNPPPSPCRPSGRLDRRTFEGSLSRVRRLIAMAAYPFAFAFRCRIRRLGPTPVPT